MEKGNFNFILFPKEIPKPKEDIVLLIVSIILIAIFIISAIFSGSEVELSHFLWIDLITNSLISFFCGTVALSISFIFSFEHMKSKTFFSFLFFLSFYISGILDIKASFTTSVEEFVFIRILSLFLSSIIFIIASIVFVIRLDIRLHFLFKIALIIFPLILAFLVDYPFLKKIDVLLPPLIKIEQYDYMHYESFSPTSLYISGMSAINFIVAFYFFYFSYKRYDDNNIMFYLMVYTLTMGFSSAFFGFSIIWNPLWWLWNVIRLTIHISILGLIIIGFVYTFNKLNEKNEQLLKAYEELKKAQDIIIKSEKKNAAFNMAASIIHEIRTPLATINNLVEALIMARFPNQSQDISKLIRLIKEEIQRIKTVTDIFNLAYGNYKPRKCKINISRALSIWIAKYIMLYRGKRDSLMNKLNLYCNLEKNIYIHIDPYALRMCINNILQNSLEALVGVEDPKIEISLEKNKYNNKLVLLLCVKDNGTGISNENLSKIWEPFFTSKTNSLGLGLFIVKKVIEAHGGWIEVESKPGNGTKLSLYIPFHA